MTTVNRKTSARDTGIVTSYLNDISRVPLLSQEEETELAAKAAAGDKAARSRIVAANLRFVVNVAKKYQNRGLELEDLISEGNIGLMMAIDRFDASKGYRFISYAVWWIRQSILKALHDKSRLIRVPVNRAMEVMRIKDAIREAHGAGKTEEQEIREVANNLGMTESHVREMLNISRNMVSLDMELPGPEASQSVVADFIEDTRNETPESYAFDAVLKGKLNELLDRNLSEREAEVLRARFGLDGGNVASLKELGLRFNLSKERVRQIEKTALYNLRECDDTYRLDGYVA